MNYGRQLSLFLLDGTSSGPRFYEIVNRTIQAIVIPATRIAETMTAEWSECQRRGVYLVLGSTEEGSRKLYIGKGENIAKRVQVHPEKLDFEVETLLLVSNKDENLNSGQVSWLESHLISEARASKRIVLCNIQSPEKPTLAKPELATVSEFVEDLILIAQTAGFDFFVPPKAKKVARATTPADEPGTESNPEFTLSQPNKGITAHGFLSDDGFVVKEGSDASGQPNDSLAGSYLSLRSNLIEQGVLEEKEGDSSKLTFTTDYAFSAPSPAAAIVVGNNYSGNKYWKTEAEQTLGDYLDSLTAPPETEA